MIFIFITDLINKQQIRIYIPKMANIRSLPHSVTSKSGWFKLVHRYANNTKIERYVYGQNWYDVMKFSSTLFCIKCDIHNPTIIKIPTRSHLILQTYALLLRQEVLNTCSLWFRSGGKLYSFFYSVYIEHLMSQLFVISLLTLQQMLIIMTHCVYYVFKVTALYRLANKIAVGVIGKKKRKEPPTFNIDKCRNQLQSMFLVTFSNNNSISL